MIEQIDFPSLQSWSQSEIRASWFKKSLFGSSTYFKACAGPIARGKNLLRLSICGKLGKQIESKVSEVARMRSQVRKSKGKVGSAGKDKERDKGGGAPNKKQQQMETARREAARTKRMQELMRHVGTILRQVRFLAPLLSFMFLLLSSSLHLCSLSECMTNHLIVAQDNLQSSCCHSWLSSFHFEPCIRSMILTWCLSLSSLCCQSTSLFLSCSPFLGRTINC